MRLTERDSSILRSLMAHRVLTAKQLKSLYFQSMTRTYKRLRILRAHGLIEEAGITGNVKPRNFPVFFKATSKGHKEILGGEDLPEQSNKWHYRRITWHGIAHVHYLNVTRIEVTKILSQSPDMRLDSWFGDRESKFEVFTNGHLGTIGCTKASIVPDSIAVMAYKSQRYKYAIEADRGTLSRTRTERKLLAYRALSIQGFGNVEKEKVDGLLWFTSSSSRLRTLLEIAAEITHHGFLQFRPYIVFLPEGLLSSESGSVELIAKSWASGSIVTEKLLRAIERKANQA